jgi:hypothetical protein
MAVKVAEFIIKASEFNPDREVDLQGHTITYNGVPQCDVIFARATKKDLPGLVILFRHDMEGRRIPCEQQTVPLCFDGEMGYLRYSNEVVTLVGDVQITRETEDLYEKLYREGEPKRGKTREEVEKILDELKL